MFLRVLEKWGKNLPSRDNHGNSWLTSTKLQVWTEIKNCLRAHVGGNGCKLNWNYFPSAYYRTKKAVIFALGWIYWSWREIGKSDRWWVIWWWNHSKNHIAVVTQHGSWWSTRWRRRGRWCTKRLVVLFCKLPQITLEWKVWSCSYCLDLVTMVLIVLWLLKL